MPQTARALRSAAADAASRLRRDPQPAALPQPPDTVYYSARDLDVYPRPIAPLALDRIAAANTAPPQVAAVLRIDEQGIVNEVAFPEPVEPERLREELRALLAATRFAPARKDGRAVKSRVVLSVDFGQDKRER